MTADTKASLSARTKTLATKDLQKVITRYDTFRSHPIFPETWNWANIAMSFPFCTYPLNPKHVSLFTGCIYLNHQASWPEKEDFKENWAHEGLKRWRLFSVDRRWIEVHKTVNGEEKGDLAILWIHSAIMHKNGDVQWKWKVAILQLSQKTFFLTQDNILWQ